jgi:hypothetical protein
MKRSKLFFLIFFLFTVITVFLFWHMSSNDELKEGKELSSEKNLPAAVPPAISPTPASPNSPRLDPIETILRTPFQFYGIVLDQDGKPVVGVKVDAAVMNNFAEGGTPVSATSDAAGRFSIQSQGASLHVHVSKSGYYQVDPGGSLKPSSQGFDFGVDQGRGVHRSDPASPDVFHLRKAGNPVVLERFETSSKVPRDGSPVVVRLSKTSNVTLRVRCRTIEDGKTPTDPYDWRCEVDVEGGGIQDRTDETNFSAPEEGYASSAVIDMPKSLGVKKWFSRATRNYWLRFPDNTFGRIEFQMIARGDHFADIGGYRNPTANIRNLEPKVVDR